MAAAGRKNSANLIRAQLRPEVTAAVDTFVESLMASAGGAPTAQELALIQSATVSYRVIVLASQRPITAYLRARGRGLQLTAH